MAYGIMRCEKMHRQECGNIMKEHNRDLSDRDKNRFLQSDIDWDRTGDNVFLVKTDDWKQTLQNELDNHDIKKTRKDAVIMLDAIYTASPEWLNSLPKDKMMEYFNDCLKWHEETYGKAINAVIHFDEATPHMHINSIPLVEKSNGKWALSAKDIMGNQKDYHKRQDDFHEQVCKKYNLERGQIKDKEHNREHYDTLQYKIRESSKDLLNSMEALEQNKQDAANLQQKLEIARDEYQKEINKRERIGKTWIGKAKDKVTVSKEGYERALSTCKDFDNIDARQQHKQKELDKRQKQLDQQKQEQEQRHQEQEQRQRELDQKQRDIELLIQQQVDQRTKELTKRNEDLERQYAQYLKFLDEPIYCFHGTYQDNAYDVKITAREIAKVRKEQKVIAYEALDKLLNEGIINQYKLIDQKLDKSRTQSVTQTKTHIRSRDDDFER